MTTKPKVAIYIRTAMSGDTANFRAQNKAVRTLAEKHGYQVDEDLIFSDVGSASKPGRPGFEQMMKTIERGNAKGIIAFKFERLARNLVDGGRIMHSLQRGIIEELITEDGTYAPDSHSVLLSLQFGMANQFSLPKKRKHPLDCDCCCYKVAGM